MDYQQELEKLKRDNVALQVQRNEFRPSGVRKKGETTYEMHDIRKSQILAEAISPDMKLYNKWAIRTLSDETYHIIARVYILPYSDRFVVSYQALLEEAINISQLPPVKRGLFSWFTDLFSDTLQKRLRKIDSDLEALRKDAQQRINESISEFSKSIVPI